ncbi:MAG: CPBP family intramembrane metalloprotease [Mollicutes bacterium]|nr:CPBP family intramembrane metalloprotease [Mollicutes bacterium]
MDNKEKDLTKVSSGITIMFALFWIYRLFIEKNLNFLCDFKSSFGTLLLYTMGPLIFIYITKDIKENNYKKKKIPFKIYLTCFFLQFTTLITLMLVSGIFIIITKNIPNKTIDLNFSMIFSLLIFAPIVEEIVFRHLLAKKLLKHGDAFYIFVSAFCFSLVHGFSMGIPTMIYTFILGLIWSYLLVKTGNIIIVIAFHSLSNLFGSIFTQILSGFSDQAFMAYFFLIIIFAIIGIILFIKNKKDFSFNEKIFGKNNLKQVFSNKGIIFYIIITIVFMIIKQLLV